MPLLLQGMRVQASMRIMGWVLVWLGVLPLRGMAQVNGNLAEQYLFQAVNAERVAHGLPALAWDASLRQAARRHAEQMAERRSIAHQYPGEADLAERAQIAGARFSRVAENVAEGGSAPSIHEGLMRSPHHRDNVLDGDVDRVGIAVVSRGGELFAVEDFDRELQPLSFAQQEATVAQLLRPSGITAYAGAEEARATCQMETGYAGSRQPWFVMRFTASELTALPEELRTRLGSGRFHMAWVGACPARHVGSFAGYSVAVMLFP